MRSKAETSVLADFRAGKNEAFAYYHRLHYDRIFNYLSIKTQNRLLAEELVQEAFIVLFKGRAKIKNEQHLAGFLHKSASHLLLQYLRKHKCARPTQQSVQGLEDEIAAQEDPEALKTETLLSLEFALQDLSLHKRRIVVLYYFIGLDTRNIAMRLNISNQTVRNHLSQAISFLRNRIPYPDQNKVSAFHSCFR